jgi:hypothetical protein
MRGLTVRGQYDMGGQYLENERGREVNVREVDARSMSGG